MSIFLLMAVAIALLQVADFATSYYCFSRNLGHEANPFVAYLIERLGLVVALVIVKGVAVVIPFVLLGIVGSYDLVIAKAGLVLLCGIYAWVVWNNLTVIRKATA